MKATFWGVRGSIPVPGPDTVLYGGNTSCVALEMDDRVLIFDAGTGIRGCGNALMGRGGPIQASIFISHTHWDHIQGFPFFVPAYIPGNEFTVYGPPSAVQDLGLQQIMEFQSSYEYFPVHVSQLAAQIKYVNCREGPLPVDTPEMYASLLNHPVTSLAYKVEHDGKTFVYGGDHEPFRNIYRDSSGDPGLGEQMMEELDAEAEAQNRKIVDFLQGADLVVWDAQYSAEEYTAKIGWGHSSYDADVALAKAAGVKTMILTHHDPMSDDKKLEGIEAGLRKAGEEAGVEILFSREGMSREV